MIITLQDALARGKGVERPFTCPVHADTNPSASVNIAKGVWYCYTCGAKGKIGDVPQATENEENDFLASLNFDNEMRIYPESWLDVFDSGPIHEYWLSRFTPEACKYFRLGYDYETETPTYPIRNSSGQVLGVVRRNLATNRPKYKYPKGVSIKNCLFNHEKITSDTLVIVEGAMDVVACYEAEYDAVGVYGAQLHQSQIQMINRLGVSKVILAFDMDTAGQNAKDQAIYSLQNLLSLMHIYVAEWHPKLGKDMGDLSLEARQQILDDAEMITFW